MLQTIQRAPTPAERSILELQQLYAQQKLNTGFNWKNALLTGGFFIAILITFFWVDGHWFLFVLSLILGLVLYSQIRSYYSDRKLYQERFKLLNALISTNSISILECRGSRMLYLENYDDEGSFYLIEVGEGRLLCYHQSYHDLDIFAPNDHIKLYADEEVKNILGTGIELLGQPISPLIILGEVKLELLDNMQWPAHLEVIEKSIEEVLDQCKQQLRTKIGGS